MTSNKLFRDMPKQWPLSIAGAIALSITLSYFNATAWPGLVMSAAVAALATFTVVFFISRHDARLTARMKADAPFAYDVWMNEVQIGRITDSQYAAIQRHAFGDGRVVVGQALNLCRVGLSIAGKVFVGVPLLMFWMLVVAAVTTPESINEFAAAWRTADVTTLTASLSSLANLVATVSVLSVGIMFVLGFRFGFRNYYDEAVSRMIRQRCNTPTEGDIHLAKVEVAPATNANVETA